jgi:uncharacterized protein (TIGR01777 family)
MHRSGMRIVLSGATGFLGGAMIAAWQREHVVAALVRDPMRARSRLPAGVEPLAFEAREGRRPDDAVVEAVARADAIVNLAGEPVIGRWNDEKKRAIIDSRVQTTAAIVAAIEASGRRDAVLVNASAVGFYGDREEPVDEDAAPSTDFLGDTCVRWERAAHDADRLGARVCTVRIGIVLGAGGALAQMVTPFRLGAGGPIGSGRQWMPWVHVDDVVGLFTLAATDPRARGALNAVAPGIVRNAELAKELGRVLHRPALVPTPAFALRLLFGEGAAPLLTGQRAVPAKAAALGYAFRWPTLGPALADAVQQLG